MKENDWLDESNKKRIFSAFQTKLSHSFHPNTCGNNSKHRLLEYSITKQDVYCPDCDYRQPIEESTFFEMKDLLLGLGYRW